ncbi:hypothetical protein AVEN_175933-1 [Araneus ventricosus]|uniref:Uncharacterized protein n=1 Tax=Araneus ventricosus TaxID=182803 RepID=A0A4Y2QZ85_ARAVE|nr:hypothetical protein AVEN_175933-1 [Araneus ventricosus]
MNENLPKSPETRDVRVYDCSPSLLRCHRLRSFVNSVLNWWTTAVVGSVLRSGIPADLLPGKLTSDSQNTDSSRGELQISLNENEDE